MISEDFSYYQREVPGLFFMLGARNEVKGYVNELHNLKFDLFSSVLLLIFFDGANIDKINGYYINFVGILLHHGFFIIPSGWFVIIFKV